MCPTGLHTTAVDAADEKRFVPSIFAPFSYGSIKPSRVRCTGAFVGSRHVVRARAILVNACLSPSETRPGGLGAFFRPGKSDRTAKPLTAAIRTRPSRPIAFDRTLNVRDRSVFACVYTAMRSCRVVGANGATHGNGLFTGLDAWNLHFAFYFRVIAENGCQILYEYNENVIKHPFWA